MRVKLDVNSVAAKQLESAIWMYAYDYDEVAVHTVAGAAFEIYTKRLGQSSFSKDVEKYIKPEKIKEFIGLWNKPYNFFKHGEHEHKELDYIEYDEESVEAIIYLTAESNLVGDEEFRLSCARVFQFFYLMKHPEQFDARFYHEYCLKQMATLNLNHEVIKSKETLRVWLNGMGNTFLNGTNSPFRNIVPK